MKAYCQENVSVAMGMLCVEIDRRLKEAQADIARAAEAADLEKAEQAIGRAKAIKEVSAQLEALETSWGALDSSIGEPISPPQSGGTSPTNGTGSSTTVRLPACSYELFGVQNRKLSSADVMVSIFKDLYRRDPSFVTRFAAHPKKRRKRPILARSRNELYPRREGKPDLSHESESVCEGWFISTNHNNEDKEKIIQLACEVAAIKWGKDLRVNLA